MKKLIVLLLIVCTNVNAQNDFLLNSYDRPIIEATVNGNDCYLLIDTGSSINIIDFAQLEGLGVRRRFKMGDAVSISGGTILWQIFQVPVIVTSRNVTQFIASDLTAVRESILQSTGIKISGILGTPAIKQLGMIIDLSRGIVTIKADPNNLADK